jgi:DNA-binding MarR family transcriptional regulator
MATRVSLTRETDSADAETYAIEESLGYLLNRAARLIAQGFAERLAHQGVALGQWAILLFLYARDGQTQADLSRVVAIEPPTVARTIERMERDGLVLREPDPQDRRATRVYLTPRARQLKEALIEESVAANAHAARVLSADELRTLQDLLRRVIAGLAR